MLVETITTSLPLSLPLSLVSCFVYSISVSSLVLPSSSLSHLIIPVIGKLNIKKKTNKKELE